MSGLVRRCALSIGTVAVILLPGRGNAQMQPTGIRQNAGQQNGIQQTGIQEKGAQQSGAEETGLYQEFGIWQSGSAASSSSDSTASSLVMSPARASSGASSWSAGRGSFGARNAMFAVTRGTEGTKGGVAAGDTGKSSWVAGRGSFGPAAQPGGIWRENAGFSTTTSTAATNKTTNGATLHAAMPNFAGINSPFTIKPLSTLPAHAAAPHALVGGHAGGGLHSGTLSKRSSGFHSSSLGRTGMKPATTGLHGRTSALNRGQTSFGIGTKPSGFGSTTPAPSDFAPSSSTSGGGATGDETAPAAPPQ
jgi:hypothetical protein